MKVAIQGQKASFHDIAARKYFSEDIEVVACDSFEECFDAAESGRADVAVVAIENSLYGSINPVYDSLLKHSLRITGEIYLHIEQCLIGLPDAGLNDISEVHSQIMALAQSKEYLKKNLPKSRHIEEYDTTASVELVKNIGKIHKAAIASSEAARQYGMKIIVRGIETNKQNYTRFVVLDPNPAHVEGANKTSMILRTPMDTKPGALYRALGVFAKRGVNLFLLHSRPIKETAWHYMFYLDVGDDAATDGMAAALSELDAQGCEVTILGSYKNGQNI